MISFNRNPVVLGKSMIPWSHKDIEGTPALFRASMEDAFVYGGDLTRYVLSKAPIQRQHKYIAVDTKVHMLFPGMIPAIPGWHTDGAPRSTPIYGQKQAPDIFLQEKNTAEGDSILYHLLVTGVSTKFLDKNFNMTDKELAVDGNLYARMTSIVDDAIAKNIVEPWTVPAWTWATFDWWNIHKAVAADRFQWRYLIRITESNYVQPNTDLRKVLRSQQQVYINNEYGW